MSAPLDPKARHELIQRLFLEARRLDGDRRVTYLDGACDGDAELRAEVELLLQHDRPHTDSPQSASGSGVRQELEALHSLGKVPADPGLPEAIGEYRILGKLGVGGMGIVYEAVQETLQRTVALKVLRAGVLSAQAERRFEYESEFLGRLQHPGIARIYDSGRAETAFGSQPYFAMELVIGESLTAHADRLELSARARIELLARVADAVQHAHQQGVVHRDLKPDNVLVDETGQPKILDFGIARAVDADLQRTTLETHVGQILGTLAYMSPEQAAGDPAAIDLRTDVYALGVLLYELLAGRLPLEVSDRGLAEAVRVIQEEQPRRLSTVHASLRGDVDTIVGTALAKEKERRYVSAAALAEDLRRFLRDEPIAARPASQLYVLGKFVRRNKVVVAATGAVLLSLVGGLLASVRFGMREAVRTEQVLQLSTLQDATELIDEAEGEALWPVHPERIPAYREWLSKAAEQIELLEQNRARLEELRSFAALERGPGPEPSSDEAELLLQRTKLDAKIRFLNRVHALWLATTEPSETPSAEALEFARLRESIEHASGERVAALQSLEAAGELERSVIWHLYIEAFERVYIKRELFGEELLGLALAERAHELARLEPDEPLLAEIVDALAWGYFITGRIEDARRSVDEVSGLLPVARPERRYFLEGSTAQLNKRLPVRERDPDWGEGILNILQKREAKRAELSELLDQPRYVFGADDAGNSWWHAELEGLVAKLELLQAEVDAQPANDGEPDWSIRGRLAFAEQQAADFAEGGKHFERWRDALPQIQAAYPGLSVAMQVGLVPLGPDPDSEHGHWLFAHLASGAEPTRDGEGRFVIDADTGLVLVLLPGGKYTMGAHADAELASEGVPNYDPGSGSYEWPQHRVELSPFFVSKYEMTQGQWLRLAGEVPANNPMAAFTRPGSGSAPAKSTGKQPLPVTMVSWDDSTRLCMQFGLELPTEAQWEYASRAGTDSVWWTGNDEAGLASAANLADDFALHNGGPPGWDYETWSDGYTAYAPVDALRPNAFGLHHTIGNVSEWCQDTHVNALYGRLYSVDPVGVNDAQILRMNRGGSLADRAKNARSSKRNPGTRGTFDMYLGLRPVWAGDPESSSAAAGAKASPR